MTPEEWALSEQWDRDLRNGYLGVRNIEFRNGRDSVLKWKSRYDDWIEKRVPSSDYFTTLVVTHSETHVIIVVLPHILLSDLFKQVGYPVNQELGLE